MISYISRRCKWLSKHKQYLLQKCSWGGASVKKLQCVCICTYLVTSHITHTHLQLTPSIFLPLLPTATTTPTTRAASKPRGNRHRRMTSCGPPSLCRRRPCRPGRGVRGEGLRRTRLHIPAGILRIPVFSVPVALFPQESGFLFRHNFCFTPSGILAVPGLRRKLRRP